MCVTRNVKNDRDPTREIKKKEAKKENQKKENKGKNE